MVPRVFHIEDELDMSDRVEATLQRQNIETVIARSTESAWPIAEEGGFGFALIDQRLPEEDDGAEAASISQVFELASKVAEQAPFAWLTAHALNVELRQISNCTGVITKAGDVTTELRLHTLKAFPDLEPELVLDEVMVELSNLDGSEVRARVPTWRPDEEFVLKLKRLEDWVASEVRHHGSRYFRARAWLGAERHGQLDLTEWEPMPQPKDVKDHWDE